MKTLIVLFSYHHHNTEKVAEAMAKVLDAQIKTPLQATPEELKEYDLVGFGSGIYGGKHHKSLLDLADNMPQINGRKAFIFSTNGIPTFFSAFESLDRMGKNQHLLLREKLQLKGYVIIDEFACTGFNTNSFLEYFGGINKGRPNEEDRKRAEAFALKLKHEI